MKLQNLAPTKSQLQQLVIDVGPSVLKHPHLRRRFVVDRVPFMLLAMALILSSMLTPYMANAQNKASSPAGDWTGTLQVQAQELHLALHITLDQSGTFAATLDSIDQGAKGIPISAVTWKDSILSFDAPTIHGHYQGTMKEDGMAVSGTWTQGSASLPLVWHRGKAAELYRPQEPKAPFPYKTEEVFVDNIAENVKLAGTFTLPLGSGPFPAVLLITGSGPQDRDETVFGHKPFLVLADFLTRRGIAVLRLDDRGVGSSTGRFTDSTTADFATDAAAAVVFMRNRKDVQKAHIGLIGHSEGGIIAPMVAAQSQAVSFVILLAGTGVPGRIIIPEQIYQTLRSEGESEGTASSAAKRSAALLDVLHKGGSLDDALRTLGAEPKSAHEVSAEQLKAETDAYSSRWFRFFADYDPYPTLRSLRCPVLALNGSNDVQVSAALNVPFLRSAVAWNPRSHVETIPGVNHLFQRSSTGSPLEYATISETIDPDILKQISAWIHEHTLADELFC